VSVQSEQVTLLNAEWSITLSGDHADIHALPGDATGPDPLWPRVGHGAGVGIALARLDSLIDALHATLADPVAREVMAAHGPEQPAWSRPGIDRTERVVYLHGPATIADTSPGYHLTARFQVPIETIRQLCTRLRGAAAQSVASQPR